MYLFQKTKAEFSFGRLPTATELSQNKTKSPPELETWILTVSFYNIPYNIFTNDPRNIPNLSTKNPNLQMTVTTYLQMTQQKIQASARRCPSWCNLLHILVISSLSDWGWCTFPDQMVAFSPSSCCLGMFATPQPEFCRKKNTPSPDQTRKISYPSSDLDLSASLYL